MPTEQPIVGSCQDVEEHWIAELETTSLSCSSNTSPRVDEAGVRLDGDWMEVSVPECSGAASGVDEFRMLYFEERWRFIYTDLLDTRSTSGR